MNEQLSFSGFVLRVLFALALVLLTFNPSGYSYVHMVAKGFPQISPVEAVCGILLLIGWFVFLGATLKSIGLLGMLLAWLGWATLIVGAFSAFVFGGIFGVALMIGRKATRKPAVPIGPFMLLGAAFGIWLGQPLADWYLAMTGLT